MVFPKSNFNELPPAVDRPEASVCAESRSPHLRHARGRHGGGGAPSRRRQPPHPGISPLGGVAAVVPLLAGLLGLALLLTLTLGHDALGAHAHRVALLQAARLALAPHVHVYLALWVEGQCYQSIQFLKKQEVLNQHPGAKTSKRIKEQRKRESESSKRSNDLCSRASELSRRIKA